MSAEVLYTPEVLDLATGLAAFPWDEGLPLRGQARSKSCGSAIALGLALDGQGHVMRIGIRSQACAIGQAAAAIFAREACGRTLEEIAQAGAAIDAWLGGNAPMPDWPGLATIARARDYPARHGAVQLAWRAAGALLPSG